MHMTYPILRPGRREKNDRRPRSWPATQPGSCTRSACRELTTRIAGIACAADAGDVGGLADGALDSGAGLVAGFPFSCVLGGAGGGDGVVDVAWAQGQAAAGGGGWAQGPGGGGPPGAG